MPLSEETVEEVESPVNLKIQVHYDSMSIRKEKEKVTKIEDKKQAKEHDPRDGKPGYDHNLRFPGCLAIVVVVRTNS